MHPLATHQNLSQSATQNAWHELQQGAACIIYFIDLIVLIHARPSHYPREHSHAAKGCSQFPRTRLLCDWPLHRWGQWSSLGMTFCICYQHLPCMITYDHVWSCMIMYDHAFIWGAVCTWLRLGGHAAVTCLHWIIRLIRWSSSLWIPTPWPISNNRHKIPRICMKILENMPTCFEHVSRTLSHTPIIWSSLIDLTSCPEQSDGHMHETRE